MSWVYPHIRIGTCQELVSNSATFKSKHESFCWLASQTFLVQVSWLLRFFCFCFFLDCVALGPTVILKALACLDKGPETRGLSSVLGVVGIISIFMYWGDGDQLMNGPIPAVVIFFLLMWGKCLLLSLTPFLQYDTHAHTHTRFFLYLSVPTSLWPSLLAVIFVFFSFDMTVLCLIILVLLMHGHTPTLPTNSF